MDTHSTQNCATLLVPVIRVKKWNHFSRAKEGNKREFRDRTSLYKSCLPMVSVVLISAFNIITQCQVFRSNICSTGIEIVAFECRNGCSLLLRVKVKVVAIPLVFTRTLVQISASFVIVLPGVYIWGEYTLWLYVCGRYVHLVTKVHSGTCYWEWKINLNDA